MAIQIRIFILVATLGLLSAPSTSQPIDSLKQFKVGEVASAADVNANFNHLLQLIRQNNTLGLTCDTYSRQAFGTIECPVGQVMTGGGFAVDPVGKGSVESIIYNNQPEGNGWNCNGLSALGEPVNCYVRCCGEISPNLGAATYCTNNYCVETVYREPPETVAYRMVLEEGVYRKFPFDFDETFVFGPESIGRMSWWVRYNGQVFDVNNLDEACLAAGDPEGQGCFAPWENADILRSALLSGELEVSPGPLGILDEIQFANTSGTKLRISSTLDRGFTVADIELASTGYTLYRPISGTGLTSENCTFNMGVGFLTDTVGVTGSDVIPGWERSNQLTVWATTGKENTYFSGAARIGACTDEPLAGNYVLGFVALDGVGGKKFLGNITVTVAEERRTGGEVVPNN